MGVRFGREYADIIVDFTAALQEIGDSYTFFEMEAEDWAELGQEEKQEMLRTLADDLFFGLGSEPSIPVGSGEVKHDASRHVLQVITEHKIVHVVRLV
ncbi:hypothetical protein [Paenibacillus turpanensis]|uniref:hypothetical protein n=1 Tax=Paenibacillus turpanensis TaxID=2689078 RepID=UPI00140D3E0B|nr:hypothetical protein [Paenibacillus turpanensis]